MLKMACLQARDFLRVTFGADAFLSTSGLLCGLSLVVQTVKNLLAMQETRVQALGQEDPLEKEIATLSSILAWRIPWTEGPDGIPFMGSQRAGHE